MNGLDFLFCGQALRALPSGALWWADHRMLCVSDLHLGKSERLARRSGLTLPPYDSRNTLDRLSADLDASGAETVLCLGDSFDDLDASNALAATEKLQITRLQAGREWIWIEGNHDPGPIELGGTHLAEWAKGPLVFRHIAEANAKGEVSGHFHPKARLSIRGRSISRPAFLVDQNRLILPAYGTYTGGLCSSDHVLSDLMQSGAMAVLTGPNPQMIPMPRKT
ncbi:ligase-associated DNA damage response endonuclease PdeM [Ruegeria sp. SCPT10]|uniref:ligase-associated DNA damage response endonuclease PdeM n=1 Tax=Ruegeria sp. SCP10 TaxID=3141377 RepID=UPI00333806C7